jgi:hypothetical protein
MKDFPPVAESSKEVLDATAKSGVPNSLVPTARSSSTILSGQKRQAENFGLPFFCAAVD